MATEQPDEQRADQSRPVGDRDAVEIGQSATPAPRSACSTTGTIDLEMPPRGQLGHDAAIRRVDVVLGGHDARQHACGRRRGPRRRSRHTRSRCRARQLAHLRSRCPQFKARSAETREAIVSPGAERPAGIASARPSSATEPAASGAGLRPALVHDLRSSPSGGRAPLELHVLLRAPAIRIGRRRRPAPWAAPASVAGGFGCSTMMSGVMPLPWIERPLGVKYFAVVRRRPEPSDSGMMVCTEPLPKLWVPIDHGPAPVLERARHDLGGRGAALVDEHHHREVSSSTCLELAWKRMFWLRTRPSV